MAKRRARQGDPGIPLGGVRIPTRDFTKNAVVIGSVGSGKSVTIDLILLQALGGIGRYSADGMPKQRAIIYDPPGEKPAQLEAMGYSRDEIINCHPLDQRCRPWAMSSDIRTSVQATSLGNILIEPNPKATDPYWDNSARNVVVAVIRYLNIVAPRQWTFRDLVLMSRSENTIRLVLQDEPRLAHLLAGFGSDKTAANIMGTLISHLEKYEVIAALWHKAEMVYCNKPFSLTEWVSSSSIIVLARSETAKTALQTVNRAVLTRLIELLMETPLSSTPVTWLFLDELGSLGGFKPLLTAVTELRKRGVAIVVGFQSLSHVVENFNEHISNTILANFNHIAALRLSDATTEEWVRKLFGKVRFSRLVQSTSHNFHQGKSRTITPTHGEEDVLRPGVMGDIPIFDPAHGTGLTGVYKAADSKWWHTYPPSVVNELPPQGDPSRNFIPMPEEYQELEPWTYADYQRLNIEHLYDGPIEDIPVDALPSEETPLELNAVNGMAALPASGVPLDINQLRSLTAKTKDLSATDYLEQQFQKFEQQYGISFSDDEEASDDSTVNDTE